MEQKPPAKVMQYGSSFEGKATEGLTTETSSKFTDEIVALPDKKDPREDSIKSQGLVSFVMDRFNRSKDKRLNDEQRWLECYRNYRGLYGPEVQFTSTERSKAFIKITKTKVLAAYAQILDILFAGNKFPIGVEPSKIPEGIDDAVHIDPKEPLPPTGQQPAQGPGLMTRPDLMKNLGPLKSDLERVQDKLKDGPGKTPTSLTWEPAKEAARKMEKKMHDQLEQTHADKHLRSFVFEMSLFGHGVMKGPFARDKEYPKWTTDGEYQPVLKQVADIEFVSIWDAYPDPDAINMATSECFIQRHKMSKTQLRALKKRPGFKSKSIEAAISDGFNYQEQYWESELNDYNVQTESERYEVLEFWGYADTDFEEIAELDIPDKYKDKDQVQVNIWVCNGHVLRAVFNSFTPARIPYHSCPYELNPYSFFGIGIAENMSDTQLLMNGFMRQAVDNVVLSGNVMLEVNESNLVAGQDFEIFPGKVWRTMGGVQPGATIHSVKIDNHAQENLMLFDKARQLADEATGMPSYAHGQGGVQGIGRTASGMQMLMGAAAQNIKAVVRNIDDYLLVPLGKALFAFNMQFDFDKDFVGDLEVVARGTQSLMRNEVRSQKLLQFLQLTNNPMDGPFVKRDYILRELAESLDLEHDKVVNDPREAGIQALMMQDMMRAQGIDPNKQQGQAGGGPSAASPPEAGAAKVPAEQGFSGGGGGSANAAAANQQKAAQ